MSLAASGPCDEAVARAVPETPCGRSAARWTLAATILGSGMAFVDGSVVNVALPVLQKSLNASAPQVQWLVEAYLLFLSSLVLVGGSLGDRIGRRRVFLAGVALFAAASAACGLAPGVGALIVARAVQGIGAALLIPSSLAILGSVFPAGERGRAIGIWSSLTAIAGVIGPLLGGWLVQVSSWRAVFFINLPMAAAVAGITFAKVPESRNARAKSLDLPGALLATLGLGGLVFGLIEAPTAGWQAPRVWISLSVGAAALCAFAAVERRSRHPMVPGALLRNRVFVGANLLTLFLYAALSEAFFFLPFDLIQAQGYPPARAGAAILPLVLILFALSRTTGAIADRIGPRILLTAGPASAAVGFFLLSVPGVGARYATAFLPALVVLGLGMAMTVAPLTTTVLNAVEPEQQGTASGVNNAVARVAGLLAIAALGIVASRSFDRTLTERLSQPGFSAAAREIPRSERNKLGAAQPPAGLRAPEAARVREAIAFSLVAAFRVLMRIAAALALLGSISALVLVSSPSGARGRVDRRPG
jgi:EmrB/QacA subfamily drug resistance transporter